MNPLEQSAKKDLDIFLGYELGDYGYFNYDEDFEIQESDDDSVWIYVEFNEEKVSNLHFLMKKKEDWEEYSESTDWTNVSDKWSISVEVTEERWEEVDIFDSSIKYLYIALLI